MSYARKNTILKVLTLAPCVLIAYILQGMIFPYVPIFGTKPLILPLVVMAAGLFEGRVTGGAVGLISGMLCDLSLNQPTAAFTLLLTLMGLFVGFLGDTVLVKSFPSYLLCSVGGLILCAFVQSFSLLFFRQTAVELLLDTGLRQTVISLIFVIPMYFAARGINRMG